MYRFSDDDGFDDFVKFQMLTDGWKKTGGGGCLTAILASLALAAGAVLLFAALL